jgi:hypothetical protein
VLTAWFAKWLPLLSISIYGLVYGGYIQFYDRLGISPELVGLTPTVIIGQAAWGFVLVLGFLSIVAAEILLFLTPAQPTQLPFYASLAVIFLILEVGNLLANPDPLLRLVLGVAFAAWLAGSISKTMDLLTRSNRLKRSRRRWRRRITRLGIVSRATTGGDRLSGPARRRLHGGRRLRRRMAWMGARVTVVSGWFQRFVSSVPSLLPVLLFALFITAALTGAVSVGDDAAERVTKGQDPFNLGSPLAVVFDFRASQVHLTWISGKAPSGISSRLVYLGEANGMLSLYDLDSKRSVRIPTAQVVVTASGPE